MYNYWKSKNNYIDIYLKIYNSKLFISAPVKDVFNRKLYKYNIKYNKLKFLFLNYKYKLKLKNNLLYGKLISKNNIIKDDLVFNKITSKKYNKYSKKINRQKLLKESNNYSNKIDTKCKFFYDMNHRFITKIKEEINILNELNDKEDTEAMIYILEWLTNLIKHDGGCSLPNQKNAINLLRFALKNNNGKLNCRGLAIVLTELFLAANIPARYIVCLPKEKKFDDKHVVTIAYSFKKSKWIFLDPSYNVFIYNKSKEIQSLMEFKNSIVKGKRILYNKKANYNDSELYFTKYLKAITKKFFRFKSPVNIYPGCDEKFNNNNISLNPKSFVYYNSLYETENPEIFFKKPKRFTK